MGGMMDGIGGGGDALVVLVTLLLMVLSFVAGYLASRLPLGRGTTPRQIGRGGTDLRGIEHRAVERGSVEVLDQRLARGEIDEDEYLRVRSAIES